VMNPYQPLVVTVTDADGAPVASTQVTFTAPAVGASAFFVGGGRTMTDENGRATITPWATSIKGTYQVWAGTGNADPMPFTLTNIPDEPAIIAPLLGDGQVRPMGVQFADPLTVAVRDRYGNLIEGAEVAFVPPASGATAQMPAGNVTVTDDEGRASMFVVAGDQAGSYTVVAKVASAPFVGFTLTNAEPPDIHEKMTGTPKSTNGALDAAP
jgi:hypothetical protein